MGILEPNTFAGLGCVVIGLVCFYHMITDFKGLLVALAVLLGCAAIPYWTFCMGGWHGLEMFNSVMMVVIAIIAVKK